jgi:hypothetical protein
MPKKKSYLTVTDQFCGAGGSSLGAAASGMELHPSDETNLAAVCCDVQLDRRIYASFSSFATRRPFGHLFHSR